MYRYLFLLFSCIFIAIALIYINPNIRYIKYIQPPTIYSISPSDTSTYIDKNPENFLFLDVRSKGEYEDLHAKDSISFPVADMYEDDKRATIPYDKDTKIFLICTSGRLAGVAYRFLEHHGYTNIEHIDKGIAGWINSGLPVVSRKDYETTDTKN